MTTAVQQLKYRAIHQEIQNVQEFMFESDHVTSSVTWLFDSHWDFLLVVHWHRPSAVNCF